MILYSLMSSLKTRPQTLLSQTMLFSVSALTPLLTTMAVGIIDTSTYPANLSSPFNIAMLIHRLMRCPLTFTKKLETSLSLTPLMDMVGTVSLLPSKLTTIQNTSLSMNIACLFRSRLLKAFPAKRNAFGMLMKLP